MRVHSYLSGIAHYSDVLSFELASLAYSRLIDEPTSQLQRSATGHGSACIKTVDARSYPCLQL
jgi:hypothetical protein